MGNRGSTATETGGDDQNEARSQFGVTVSSELIDDLRSEHKEVVESEEKNDGFEEWRMQNAKQLEHLDGEISSLTGKLTDAYVEISYDMKNVEHSFSQLDENNGSSKSNACIEIQSQLRDCYTKDKEVNCSSLSKLLEKCVADSIIHG